MRLLKTFCVSVLASGLMLAQTSTPNSSSDASNIANEVKKLQDAIAAQQKAMTDQQEKIAAQQSELEKLKQQLATQPQAVSSNGEAQAPHVLNATLSTSNVVPPVATASDVAQQPERPKESPLSFRIGGADFTPGGFLDFTAIFRSVNAGSLGTNFFSIPFSTSQTAHLTESRFTAQNSRVSLKVTDKFGKNDVMGYLEADFLGNDGGNVFVTSNSHTWRQRLYWVDVKREKFEVLAGQSWSWLTPNRNGLSPVPGDIFFSQNMDFNYQAGLTWTRAPQVRFAYHPNANLALGIALENPQQFSGQGTQVSLPANSFPGVAALLDNAGNSGAPNVHPDVIPKIAYDTNMGGKHFHAEAAGLLTTIKITDLPTVTGSTFVTHSKTGGGGMAAVNLEVVKNFRIVANGFYSDGGGRYIFGMGPDVVVFPTNAPGQTCTNVATTAGNPPVTTFSGAGCDLKLSLVHSGSGIFGFEAQVTPKTLLYGYYGGAYFQRNFAPDTTGKPGTLIGFGFPGQSTASNANRAIQEGTIGWIQTFWRDPQHGALQLITQGSYVTRSPWFIAAGAPKNAHLGMAWVDLRYVLP